MCHNTSKPSIERTNFFFTIGEALHAIVGDQECVFDADRAHSGNDELIFNNTEHPRYQRELQQRNPDKNKRNEIATGLGSQPIREVIIMNTETAKKTPVLELALDKSGKTVHISEVANGDACNCTCMYCGEPLTAKQGNGGKAPHFAHKPDSKCHWKEYEKQTYIHWRAEKLFLEEKEITLPQIIRTFGNIHCLMFNGGTFPITSVELEKRISDFIPDIALQIGESTLLVEIFVTHAIDEAKKDKIRNDGRYDVIEIEVPDSLEISSNGTVSYYHADQTAINHDPNGSERTYNVTFGYDADSGMLTQVGYQPAGA